METLLAHYQVNWLRRRGVELRGRCPIHRGEGENTFHVNVAKNAFHCFSCQARGNVLDFVAAMEKCSVKDAAVKLKTWFSLTDSSIKVRPPEPQERGVVVEAPTVNKPLGFQLKAIDHKHVYVKDRGITPEIVLKFGIGFFGGKGSMHGRVVIPIHNERGKLVAYAGRAIDGSEPRYKLPTGFHKSLELYNLHRVGESETVIVVEGFFDTIKVVQAGLPAVGLMGSSLSPRQEQLLVQHFKRLALMFDGDEAGRKAMEECLRRLANHLWIRSIALADGQQPDQLSTETLQELLRRVLQ